MKFFQAFCLVAVLVSASAYPYQWPMHHQHHYQPWNHQGHFFHQPDWKLHHYKPSHWYQMVTPVVASGYQHPFFFQHGMEHGKNFHNMPMFFRGGMEQHRMPFAEKRFFGVDSTEPIRSAEPIMERREFIRPGFEGRIVDGEVRRDFIRPGFEGRIVDGEVRRDFIRPGFEGRIVDGEVRRDFIRPGFEGRIVDGEVRRDFIRPDFEGRIVDGEVRRDFIRPGFDGRIVDGEMRREIIRPDFEGRIVDGEVRRDFIRPGFDGRVVDGEMRRDFIGRGFEGRTFSPRPFAIEGRSFSSVEPAVGHVEYDMRRPVYQHYSAPTTPMVPMVYRGIPNHQIPEHYQRPMIGHDQIQKF